MENDITEINELSRPDIHHEKDNIPAFPMRRIMTKNSTADLAENFTSNDGIKHLRNPDDLVKFMDTLIDQLENHQTLPQEGFSLIDEIIEKAVSSKLSANKLKTDRKTYVEDIQYLINLRKDKFPYPESKHELILLLLKFFKKELFNTKHRHFRLSYKDEKGLQYHYGIDSYIELFPTVKFLYSKYKDNDKVIDELILLSCLPMEKGLALINSTVEISLEQGKQIESAYESNPPNLDLITEETRKLFIKILKRNTGGARRLYKELREELEFFIIPILNEL